MCNRRGSLTIIEMIYKEWDNLWYLDFFKEVWNKLNGFYVTFQHVFREGDKVTNLLANNGYNKALPMTFQDSPIFIKLALFDDKIIKKFLKILLITSWLGSSSYDTMWDALIFSLHKGIKRKGFFW